MNTLTSKGFPSSKWIASAFLPFSFGVHLHHSLHWKNFQSASIRLCSRPAIAASDERTPFKGATKGDHCSIICSHRIRTHFFQRNFLLPNLLNRQAGRISIGCHCDMLKSFRNSSQIDFSLFGAPNFDPKFVLECYPFFRVFIQIYIIYGSKRFAPFRLPAAARCSFHLALRCSSLPFSLCCQRLKFIVFLPNERTASGPFLVGKVYRGSLFTSFFCSSKFFVLPRNARSFA